MQPDLPARTLTPDLEKRLYADVVRSVFWGDEREKILAMLQVNGVPDSLAETFYQAALAERIRHIRGESFRRALGGLGWLLLAVALYVGFWYGLGFIHRTVFIICFGLFIWGLWRTTDGIVSALLAPSKKGPLDLA